MKNILTFNNDKFGSVRVVEINGETWFVGKDIASALGYKDTADAISKHVHEEDKMGGQNTDPSISDSLGRKQYPIFINESGVYALIFGSKLESAKEFKHWVTSEVLPSIRKTGSYSAPRMSEQELKCKENEIRLQSAQFFANLANKYNDTYGQILDAYATKEMTGNFVLPLPETEKTYSATDIAKECGISAREVGRISNKNDMKKDEYGSFVWDINTNNGKQVQNFRYNQKGHDLLVTMIKNNQIPA